MKRLRCALFPAFAVLMLLPLQPLRAEVESDGMDIEYAEIVPLAAHSLLLDIKSVGDRFVAVGERGHVVYSDDQGASWQQASVVPTRATLTTLAVVGNRLWAAGHDSVILTSGDAGDTWTRQYFDPERQQPIMDMWFSDEDTGIAIGAYGLMLLTEDGGQNWDDWAVNDEDDAHLNNFVELEDGTLLIAGEAGFSYRSKDAGETWESIEVPYPGSMFGAALAGDGCVLFFGLRGHIQQSCDQGDSWIEFDTGSENTLAGAIAHDEGVLMVGNSGILVQYANGGGFSVSTHSSGVDFSAATYLGSGRFLLAGEDGIHAYPETSQGEQP
jgi:photosystem II stability/assembly factor-like uncharacterized protein